MVVTYGSDPNRKGSVITVSVPPLEVEISREGLVCVLSVRGELDIATAPVLAALAGPALRVPADRLVVDLSGLEFIDCGGARALAAVTRAAPCGRAVTIRGASSRIRKVLDMLAVSLERHDSAANQDRATWLVLESQVLTSWAEQACASSMNLIARSRTIRAARRDARRARLQMRSRARARGM